MFSTFQFTIAAVMVTFKTPLILALSTYNAKASTVTLNLYNRIYCNRHFTNFKIIVEKVQSHLEFSKN